MYSIIYKAKVIDVVQNPTFIKILPSGHISFTDKSSANGIIGSDRKTVYSFETVNCKNTKIVSIEEISENEFNRLKGLLNSGQEITADKDILEVTINNAISKLSEVCNSKITEGFSIRLSDGKNHNFKLTTEDQINLLNLENQLNGGSQTFIYHATGEFCKSFTRDDMIKIIKAYRKQVLYHTTYFNIAKQYIKSLNDVDKVTAFSYGMNIAWFAKDPAICKILRDGGVN